ncbi:MAG TPA: DUF1616 domain-containing protein [Ktedonobacteraceae bacterium]|nr:DUF1616 domain-containing protein [Ktedonobacteraceae bacterium]
MRIKNLDLIVVTGVVVINVLWTHIPHRPALPGILLVLPLTFIIPGYVLTQVVMRRRSPDPSLDASSKLMLRPGLKLRQPIGIADQIVLSLGLSLAIDVLVGFGLNFLPVGLQASSWALALGLFTTVLTLLAVFLRQKDRARTAITSRFRVTIYDGLLLGLAIIVVIAAVWLAIIRPLDPQPSFTQFWMLPARNNGCSVSIGMQSFETTPVAYRVVMMINHAQTDSWSSIVLFPRQTWSRSVAVTPGKASSLHVETLLYRTDEPGNVYRNDHVTLYISTVSTNGQLQYQCKI